LPHIDPHSGVRTGRGPDPRTISTVNAGDGERDLTAHGGQADVAGPALVLPPMAAQALGLAMHELATNAVKHGALSQPAGKLAVNWQVEVEDGVPNVTLEWIESGVSMWANGTPARKGYGTELIEEALPYQLGAKTKLEFGPDGVRCKIKVPVPEKPRGAKHA